MSSLFLLSHFSEFSVISTQVSWQVVLLPGVASQAGSLSDATLPIQALGLLHSHRASGSRERVPLFPPHSSGGTSMFALDQLGHMPVSKQSSCLEVARSGHLSTPGVSGQPYRSTWGEC